MAGGFALAVELDVSRNGKRRIRRRASRER
jgi:hypothetical protein